MKSRKKHDLMKLSDIVGSRIELPSMYACSSDLEEDESEWALTTAYNLIRTTSIFNMTQLVFTGKKDIGIVLFLTVLGSLWVTFYMCWNVVYIKRT